MLLPTHTKTNQNANNPILRSTDWKSALKTALAMKRVETVNQKIEIITAKKEFL